MLHQYSPQTFRRAYLRNKAVEIGTIPVGAIVYIQDGVSPMGIGRHFSTVRRNPWIVEAWHPREIGAGRCINGKWRPTYRARGGHLATVRSLRSGRRQQVADWLLKASIDLAA